MAAVLCACTALCNVPAARCASTNTLCSLALQAVPSSHHDSPYWTTNNGAPVYNNNQSLTVGVRGPVLLVSVGLCYRCCEP